MSIESCKKGNHSFVEINRSTDSFGEAKVVKWCSICGSIKVDGVFDGRIFKNGSIYTPTVSKELAKGNKISIKECVGGGHTLTTMHRKSKSYGEEEVVRWCSTCGAVVVDLDFDNRTFAENVMKMKDSNTYQVLAEV